MTHEEFIKLQDYLLFSIRMMENTTGFLTHIDKKINGFFIEAGAHKGFEQSPTHFLQQFLGWNGLLVEPNPINFTHLERNRHGMILENCALVGPSYNSDSIEMYEDSTSVQEMQIAGFMNTIGVEPLSYLGDEYKEQFNNNVNKNKKINVKVATLNFLLERYSISNIDLCILDAEGYEYEILEGFDLNKYKPKILIIEALGDNYTNKIKNYMNNFNYCFVESIHQNHIFKIK